MKYYIGLDVSMKETSICVIDEKSKKIKQTDLPTEPEYIAEYIQQLKVPVELVGLESGSLSHWLTEELLELNLPVKCIDARHCNAFLSMRINKTDQNDAHGIAEIMRCGIYKEVSLKSKRHREISSLLTSRKLLVNQKTQTLMSVRGLLKPFGVRLGSFSRSSKKLVELLDLKEIQELSKGVLFAIRELINTAIHCMESIGLLEKQIHEFIRNNEEAELLMSIPGIGPITALKYLVEIGNVERFSSSRSVGAYIGLTPRQYSSGETQRQGRISKCGSSELRTLLVEAACVMLTRTRSWSKLKAWGLRIMKKSGFKKAATAVARKLSVIMHSMLKHKEKFRFTAEEKSKQVA